MKIHQQPAYVLHARPYLETSLLLDAFTKEHGRLTLIAKGARRVKSRVRGVLLPFHPLLLSWAGKGALPIVTAAEPDAGGGGGLRGAALASGFYLNELLLLLLHRHDAHEGLFAHYGDAIARLAEADAPHVALRVFEKNLLRDIGFGLALECDVDSGEAIDADARYRYVLEKGPVRVVEYETADNAPPTLQSPATPISGRALCALRDEQFASSDELHQAQKLTRALIDRQLNGRELHSRRVLVEMKSYTARG